MTLCLLQYPFERPARFARTGALPNAPYTASHATSCAKEHVDAETVSKIQKNDGPDDAADHQKGPQVGCCTAAAAAGEACVCLVRGGAAPFQGI